VFNIYDPLWIIFPAAIFTVLFAYTFGTYFDPQQKVLKFLKKIVVYWLAGGSILFFTLLALSALNIIIGLDNYLIASATIGISALLIMYSYHNASRVFITSLSLESDKIQQEYNFVQLSDIHVGSNGKHEVARIVEKMKPLNYDFVVITGDLIDEDYATIQDLVPLHEIEKPIYYITGNHEYYLRHKHFSDFIKKTDIHDLNDKKTTYKEIDIYGMDEKSLIKDILPGLKVEPQRYSIGLMHKPESSEMKDAEAAGIDLMLSGHTHNGQIFPTNLMVRGKYKFIQGLYNLGRMTIHVSQGTGTWGPKMRLGTYNEITLVRLSPKETH